MLIGQYVRAQTTSWADAEKYVAKIPGDPGNHGQYHVDSISGSQENIMTKQTQRTQQQQNHRADSLNNNRGTSGTNLTNAKVHGNRGKQLNPNQR